jgi:hypothetical protein
LLLTTSLYQLYIATCCCAASYEVIIPVTAFTTKIGLVYGIRATDGFWVYGTRQKFSTFFLPLACGSVYAACLQLDLQALMMPQACEGTVAIKDPAIN